MAGAMAFQDAAKKAKPVLLEPVMRVEVLVPKQHSGEVMADLSSRRGQMQSKEECDGMRRIIARYQPCESDDNQDTDDLSRVGAPRKPMPTLRDSSVALPEPAEDDRRDQREEGG